MSLSKKFGFISQGESTKPVNPIHAGDSFEDSSRVLPPTDFTSTLDFATTGDLNFIPRYVYTLSEIIFKEIFVDKSIHALSPTDFKQDNLGNCWEVALLDALLDKPWGVLVVQDVLKKVECFTWNFKRPTRDTSEVGVKFDVKNTFLERSYESDDGLHNSLFLNARDPFYVYFTYGLLKAMEPLIRSNKERYNCPNEVSQKNTMEIADGFFSVSVLFFLFKNIASDSGRMQFTLSSFGSYQSFVDGSLTYSELRDRDFRVYELIEITKELEVLPDSYICIVSFFKDFQAYNSLSSERIKLRTEHTYYFKTYSSKLDMVTLVDPNNISKQIHFSFSSFLSSLCTLEYACFKDRYDSFDPMNFVRNTPLSIVEKKLVDRNCSDVNAGEDSWLDFNPNMIISTVISDYNILLVDGEYRLYDRYSCELLPLLTNSQYYYNEPSFLNADDPIEIVFNKVFEVPYDFIRSYCHVPNVSNSNIHSSFRFNVSKGYLVLNSPVDAVCIYPDLITNTQNSTLRVPYSYKKLIKPIFIRFFGLEQFGELVIFQIAPERNTFYFLVNGEEIKFSRNMFETKKFFDLKHKIFFEPSILTCKDVEGFHMSLEHISYYDINILIEFNSITTQVFN